MYCVLHCITSVFNQLKIWWALFPCLAEDWVVVLNEGLSGQEQCSVC